MMRMEWVSDLYDFNDPNVRNEYVAKMGCSVGGCISVLKKAGSHTKQQDAKVMLIDV